MKVFFIKSFWTNIQSFILFLQETKTIQKQISHVYFKNHSSLFCDLKTGMPFAFLDYKQLQKILYPEKNNTMKCVKPCKTTSFDVSLETMHQNSKKFDSYSSKVNDIFYLNLGYDEFIIETKQEYFIMDEAGLISTVGGFLGLFLGSSCISIIEWIGNHVKKCLRWFVCRNEKCIG